MYEARCFGRKLQGPSKLAVLFTVAGLVLSLAIRAGADSPNPAPGTHGTVDNNGSTATVTVWGTLTWGKEKADKKDKDKKDKKAAKDAKAKDDKKSKDDKGAKGASCKKDAGYAVAWDDENQAGNQVGPAKKSTLVAYVGVKDGNSGSKLNATDNEIHPATCSNGVLSWGPISHVYKTSNKTVTICPIAYHIKKSKLAGGPGHGDDNSIEENGVAPDPASCFLFVAPPPPPPPPHLDTPGLTIDKKVNGGDHKTNKDRLRVFIGDTLLYTVVITNTGNTDLAVSNLADTLHANLEGACDGKNGDVLHSGDTIECSYADLALAAQHNVAKVTGTPPGGDPIDVEDGTFVSIRAGVTIPPVEQGSPPPPVVANPHTTG